MRTLVMGGTRFLGIEVVEALLRAGHEVVIFHRGSRAPAWSRPVGQVLGDRTDPADLARLAALKADAILDLSAYTRAHTELLLDAVPGVPRLIHVSTVNVYRPSPLLPWPEDTPCGPHRLWGTYAVEKIGCELALRELGAPLGALYVEFDREPFAAASLAQVHRARLPDGRQVAVKVQRSGIRVQVERDLAPLPPLARRFERHQPGAVVFRPSDAVAELARYTRRELDFRREVRGQRARAPSRYSLAQGPCWKPAERQPQ